MYDFFKDSPLDLLFYNSYMYGHYVMITMKDNKVYVGEVTTFGEPTESTGIDQEFSIAPLLSGYRDKETLEVEFTTIYSEVSDNDLELVLKQENVISSTQFSTELFEKFKQHSNNKKNNAHVPFSRKCHSQN